MAQGLLRSIKRKNKLYRQYLLNPSAQNESFYKHYKNKLNHSLRIAKRLYYEKKLDATKSNIRGTWRILNEIVKNKKKTKLNSVFRESVIEKYQTQLKLPTNFVSTFLILDLIWQRKSSLHLSGVLNEPFCKNLLFYSN